MRYLTLADIHANLEALTVVLERAEGWNQVLLLGDYVGYGADPNAVVSHVRALPVAAVIRGNHDKAAAGLDDASEFNQVAREAIFWTRSTLTPENRAWLTALPRGPVVIDETIEICHGTPFDEDEYVLDRLDAFRALNAATRRVCLYGHTHVAAVFRMQRDAPEGTGGDDQVKLLGPRRAPSFDVAFESDARYLVNCGAVGQPRDGDPRAAYGILDTDTKTIMLFRVDYDVQAAQEKILTAGLPDVLARRLALGR